MSWCGKVWCFQRHGCVLLGHSECKLLSGLSVWAATASSSPRHRERKTERGRLWVGVAETYSTPLISIYTYRETFSIDTHFKICWSSQSTLKPKARNLESVFKYLHTIVTKATIQMIGESNALQHTSEVMVWSKPSLLWTKPTATQEGFQWNVYILRTRSILNLKVKSLSCSTQKMHNKEENHRWVTLLGEIYLTKNWNQNGYFILK